MAVPEGFTTITPHLMIDGTDRAIALYQQAFGAELISRMAMPNDETKVMHAMLQVGSAKLFLGDPVEWDIRKPHAPDAGPAPVAFYLYFDDADAAYKRAVAAGLTGVSEPEDMFYGDRCGRVHDPFGYSWTVATRVREVSPEEMAEAMKAMAAA